MSYMDELNFWLNDDYFDQKTSKRTGSYGRF